MSVKNAFYAQSGGVTAVINASACGVIETARRHSDKIGKLYAGHNGILGALREELIDTCEETNDTIASLRHTPGGAFGSCRYKLARIEDNEAEYQRIVDVFKAHNIGYFFYNGGGDSMDTAYKISLYSQKVGYPITCIGIPKTVDNDLPATDTCPGFGSVAKYVATSVKETSRDIESMHESSTKVFIMEVMGRHAGWITAAAALAMEEDNDPPHMLLFPEIDFCRETFLAKVERIVNEHGYCVIVASEGTHYADGTFLSASRSTDAFGHVQLGGTAPILARMVKDSLGYKYHWAVVDYLQRSARHLASAVDVEQAYAVGRAAVEFALEGKNGVMASIVREDSENDEYVWSIGEAPLEMVANVEMKIPEHFIAPDGLHITKECRDYLRPLIQGEDFPPFKNGVPVFANLKKVLEEKKLEAFEV
ncbi:6-phosphofructokinase [Sansalvadorimonas sp. 2012CJ34-2]|uniref:Pyrophosphate--fructose 6-phosphate 1-phosphotransferase n=1 Tax=Parendozoicomonas callyspongiae TaxID=2942213 RepID=A0ABT0PCY5_9GAMM|nr:6-phosphofructokinase [Sansalvadorimonas sp. 2012CJ34-2]MCL6269086.1 6-phosphofructokinase [Sansalvadorimonas sp. 2012CJ34-2]